MGRLVLSARVPLFLLRIFPFHGKPFSIRQSLMLPCDGSLNTAVIQGYGNLYVQVSSLS